MALYKRKGSSVWQTRFQFEGREIRESTRTHDKRQAEEYETALKSALWRQLKIGDKPRRKWEQAVERWLEEKAHLSSIEDQKIHLRWLDKHLFGRFLDEITRDMLDNLGQARKAEKVANSTVNRTLEIVRAILRCAEREWRWLDSSPAVRMLPEPKRRIRWLTREEADRLLSALPDHLAEMARFSLATGLRKDNVTGLQWAQVDLERRTAWIHHDQSKTKKALSVPLNAEAVLVLRRQAGKHEQNVFVYRSQPVKEANTKAWKKALKQAGIQDFRWHDLRHTWASWHVQAGTPLQVLQELGGWSSYEMVQRYAHLSSGQLAEHAENLCKLRTLSGTGVKGNVEKAS
jgi:integrase